MQHKVKLVRQAFKTWASERPLPLNNIDLVARDTPDHYDFLYEMPFSGDKVRIDVKIYIVSRKSCS